MITHCILVVEDDALLRHLVTLTLRREGYKILEAGDGAEAMDVQAEYTGPIHLLLTDIMMPRMDGHELIRAIKPQRPSMKVVVVSALVGATNSKDGSGSDRALRKPVLPEEIVLTVRQLLGNSDPE